MDKTRKKKKIRNTSNVSVDSVFFNILGKEGRQTD